MPADSTLVVHAAEATEAEGEGEWWPNAVSVQKHAEFLRRAAELLVERVVLGRAGRSGRVVRWADPEEIRKNIDLPPRPHPLPHDQLLQIMLDVTKYSVNVGHPYFANQLYGGGDVFALVGHWLEAALNASLYTYEVAPALALLEQAVLRELRSLAGWKGEGEGAFVPGGSISNGYAISLARHKAYPETKTDGVWTCGRLAVFASERAHYSTRKMAAFMGLGEHAVRDVRSDSLGRMDVADLERQIQEAIDEGVTPLMVTATAGTTVFGAFDPLRAIASVCRAKSMWLHVDAALGGGALLSRTHKHLLDGIHLADSITWNPHKMLGAGQQCSAFLTRHTGLLAGAHASRAAYLFQPDKFYDTSLDSGDQHIQCGRRADALKFWLMWKAKGSLGLERHVDSLFSLSKRFTTLLRSRPAFILVLDEPQSTNVMFWYEPECLRNVKRDEKYWKRMHQVAPKIKEGMVKAGSMLITYQPQGDLVNFFRIVFVNSSLDDTDLRHFVDEFDRLGKDIQV